MRIALAQINPVVGDLKGNCQKIVDYTHRAKSHNADLVIFPELCVVGYPPMDLLDHPSFIEATDQALRWIASEVPQDLGLIIGAPVPNPESIGKRLHNAALWYENGQRIATVYKRLLPTYDVFDEYRHFEPGPPQSVVTWRGLRFGLHICEDMWNNEAEAPFYLYDANPIDAIAAQGIDLFLNISASPFAEGRPAYRNRLIAENCQEHHVPFVMVNQVGANTELIFDGGSVVYNADAERCCTTPAFEEALVYWDFDAHAPAVSVAESHPIAEVHQALICGIRDYYEKTGFFNGVLMGLSGGIDSAVTCALAVEALGPEVVHGVTMPSKYSSSGSVDDAKALADNLGIAFYNIPIVPAVSAFDTMLEPLFAETTPGVAEENIQARTRGVTLMALSNKFNYLLLTTGNKSEMAVGYATLYGDMNGGLAVLSDVFKMEVYALAEYINAKAGHDLIPRNTITKPPSAELRPDQQDADSLPPYPVLDHILRLYIVDFYDAEAIIEATDYPPALVKDILGKVDRNEYKRRQAAPGLRVSTKAFGMGRRLPIVMRPRRVPEPSPVSLS